MKRPFEEIVAEHGPTVLRVCRAVLARPDADDAWSETFLAALRAYPDLADNANIEAWLVTIAHRKAIDVLRAESRRAVPVAVPAEPRSASWWLGTIRRRPVGRARVPSPRSSDRPSRTTMSRDCRTRRSPRSSADRPTQPGARRMTASALSAAATSTPQPSHRRRNPDRDQFQ